MRVKAVTFDVFGTVVDWRSSITREGHELGRRKGIEADWEVFADAWRGLYQPAMSRVRNGEIPWVKLDTLHRMNLEQVLGEFGITDLSPNEIDDFNRGWHRLTPWPDALEGLTRIKSKYIIATLSNGNVALIVNMAKHVGLPWDMVLGAEVAGHYKPQPEAYLKSAQLLGLAPGECMLVAAHNSDLVAAGKCGFKTGFVPRLTEHGPDQQSDLRAENDYDVVAKNFVDLAGQLGC